MNSVTAATTPVKKIRQEPWHDQLVQAIQPSNSYNMAAARDEIRRKHELRPSTADQCVRYGVFDGSMTVFLMPHREFQPRDFSWVWFGSLKCDSFNCLSC